MDHRENREGLNSEVSPTGFMVVGALTVAVGLCAIAFPVVATLAVEITTGAMLLIAGLAGLAHAVKLRGWPGQTPSVLAGLAAAVAGALLLFFPFHGVFALTMTVVVFLIASGTLKIVMGIVLRPGSHWAWLIVSGIAALVLAGVILYALPLSALWVLGLLVGVDLLFSGTWLFMCGAAVRRSAHDSDNGVPA